MRKKKYPFKFLDAYSKEDTDIFFGRDDEVDALYAMVHHSDIMVVYGASGTGKTSLIRCGLANRFQSHDWLALNIRRGNDLNVSLEKELIRAGGEKGKESSGDLNWLDSLMDPENKEGKSSSDNSMDKMFKAIYRRYFRPVYLIFDQFEELYLLGTKREQQKFIKSVQQILLVDQPITLIFVIREEYLGNLYEFEKEVPQLMRRKLRVESMNLGKVRQVIHGVAKLEKTNISVAPGEEELIADSIFNKIKGTDKTLTIQLPYLQVFLDNLYLKITGDKKRIKDAEFTMDALGEIGDIGDVLREFLEEQAGNIRIALSKKHGDISMETIWKILSPFATLEGTKEPMSLSSLYDWLPELKKDLIDDTIEAFEDSRILRYSENVELYEISHDSLAKRVASKRSQEDIALEEIRRLIKGQSTLIGDARELFSEKQLNFIEPYLDKLKLTRDQEQLIQESRVNIKSEINKAKNRLRLAVGIVVLAIGAFIIASFALADARNNRINIALIDYVNDLVSANIISDSGDNFDRLRKLKNDIVRDNSIDKNIDVLRFLRDSSVLHMYEESVPTSEARIYNMLSFSALLKLDTLFKALDNSEESQKSLIISGAKKLLEIKVRSNEVLENSNFLQIPYLYYALEEYHKGIGKIHKNEFLENEGEESIVSVIASNPGVLSQYAFGDFSGQVFVNESKESSNKLANLSHEISAISYSVDGDKLYAATALGSVFEFSDMKGKNMGKNNRKVYDNGKYILFIKPLQENDLLVIGTPERLEILKKTKEGYSLVKGNYWDIDQLDGLNQINTISSTSNGKYILIGGMNRSAIVLVTSENNLEFVEFISHEKVNISAGAITEIVDSTAIVPGNSVMLALGSEVGGLWVDLDHQLTSSVSLNESRFVQLRDHTAGITDLEFRISSHQMASSSLDGTIRLWNLKKLDSDFDHIRLKDNGQGFSSITYINDDDLISTMNNHRRVWKTNRISLAEDLEKSLNILTNN